LFINSKTGYEGDLILEDREIPCLPASPTEQSVISCSLIVKANQRQLRLFGSEKIGVLPTPVARKLHEFIKTVTTLTIPEKKLVLGALATLI
jgi:hypothetical protein